MKFFGLFLACCLFLSHSAFSEESHENPVSTGLIRFWQKVISPADGPRSPSFPTGSRYAKNAFQRYEFFTALVITADRLVHEADYGRGKTLMVGGNEKFYDPLIDNTYWWDSRYAREIHAEIGELKKQIEKNESAYGNLEK